MLNKQEEKYKVRLIPVNFEAGVTILGMNFKPRFLFEGIIIGLSTFGLCLGVCRITGLIANQSAFGYCLAFGILALVAGLRGLNDEPLSVFLLNYRKVKKRKRTAYYNPRVKSESRPYKVEGRANEELLGIDLILARASEIKRRINRKSELKAKKLEGNIFDASKMYFADDEGYISKPREYMTASEKRKQDKAKLKREKELLKLAKEMEKANRYKYNEGRKD